MPADILALFDLDHTLLSIDSDEAWVEHLIEQGAIDRASFEARNRRIGERYRRGEADVVEFTEFYLSTLIPFEADQLARWRSDFVARRVLPSIPAAARALVARHRDAGDLCVLTTATSRFLTEPIAVELGFEHLIATEPERSNGRYTGRVHGLPNMRERKVDRLAAWLSERGNTLDAFRESWFYSDSVNDIPLLSKVTHPVAVNPDPGLARHAAAHRWPVLRLA
jgi:HAD superfamily hydrolase (TIGR01490 family)